MFVVSFKFDYWLKRFFHVVGLYYVRTFNPIQELEEIIMNLSGK